MKLALLKHKLFVGIALTGVVIGIGATLNTWWMLGNNIGYAPVQPIAFSHKLHAGQLQIPCQYCHTSVDKSASAGVPPLNACMNCHNVVKPDSPEIKKLVEAYSSGKPVEWVKVHDLADHAHFNHSRHIKAGIDCATCHGDVAKMDRIQQVKTMQMGFCMECHLNNPQYPKAPSNCQSCHY